MNSYEKKYKFEKKTITPIPIVRGDVELVDENLLFNIATRTIQKPYRLHNIITPTILIPLKWNKTLKRWEITTENAFVNATVDSQNYLNVHARTIDQLPASLSTAGNLRISIEEASIKVPVEKQGVFREQVIQTTATLTAGASFTSESVDCMDFTHFHGFAYSDVDGTLKIQISSDNTNWYDLKTISLTGGSTITWNEQVVARYYRVVYTNGASDQTAFRLEGYRAVE